MSASIVVQLGLLFFLPCFLATADIVQLDAVPNHGIYELGEDINFTCCSDDSVTTKVFEFYKEGSKIHSEEQSTNCTNFEIKIKTMQDAGSFQCLYQAAENGTNIQSNMSRSITVRIAETPQPPSIKLTPPYTVYTKDESFTLICSPPTGISAKGIQIYRKTKNIYEGEPLHNNYKVSASSENASGKYTCKYWVEMNGRNISSSQSDYVIVNVTETLQPPSLSLIPLFTVYTKQESFNLTCSPPIGESTKGIQIYHEEKKIYEGEPLNSDYMISASNQDAPGKYTCSYWVEINGRHISSSQSDYVIVNVTEIPQPPSIRLTPPYTVYTKDESFTLTCLPPNGISAKRIQIYRKKKNIYEGEPLHNNYNVSASSENASGKYTCKYWVEMNGRNISSSQSDYVIVNVTETPKPPSLRLIPLFTVYTKQETFNLTCSPPIGELSKGIQIYHEEKKIHEGEPLNSDYMISASKQDAPGKYTCNYWVEINGRHISSSQSDYVTVNVTDVPRAPSISLSPTYPVYIRGESINITCSPPFSSTANGIVFYKDGQKISLQQLNTMNISTAEITHSAKYSCQYMEEILRRSINSTPSDEVTITTIDQADAPVLTLVPKYHLYVTGETLEILCVANFRERYDINIHKNGHLIIKSAFQEDVLRYSVPNLNPSANGNYTCTYHRNMHGRMIVSLPSQPLNVHVIDRPSAPNLTLGYSVEKVNDCFQVTLNCSAPDFDLIRTFYFIKESDKHSEKNVTDYSASLKWELGHVSSVIFYCEYEEQIQDRKIRSTRSQALTIPLADQADAPVLTLVPKYQLYVTGETLEILCLASSTESYDIIIHKNDHLIIKSAFQEDVLRYSVPSLNPSANGNYTCTYHRNMHGRMIVSLPSQPLNVHVIDRPSAPNLTLGYSVEKVNDCFQVTLNCSAPDFDLIRTFYFIKESDKHSEKNVTDYSASLKWELGLVSSVTFYCEYEEQIQDRKIRSTRSQALTIPLAGPSLWSPPLVAGIIGTVSLLLCLALILLFYMKYKRQYSKRFHFSLYWKTSKKTFKQHIPNLPRSKEEVNQDQETLREASSNPTWLSAATAEEDNAENIAMDFCTFQRQPTQSKYLLGAKHSTFQSQPDQNEALPSSDLATFPCQSGPNAELATANCVWNYSCL